jgi:spermidine/putrescine transport system substrate-binding protein
MRLRTKTFISVAVFFCLGLAYGAWSTSKARQKMAKTPPLRVLCADNWLDDKALQRFAKSHSTPIQLWTYSNPNEFLRQMANADGRIDVLCTSSTLVRSLVQSHWLRKGDYLELENARLIAVDFLHLPYDENSEYSVPLFWNLYGFFGKTEAPGKTWKQIWQSHKVSLWGDELNLLNMLGRVGVKVEEQLGDDENRHLETDIRSFVRSAAQILKPDVSPVTAEAMISHADWVSLPLSQVARLLGDNSPYHFWLPSDGGAVEVGVLAIGEKARYPELARALINELISTDAALEVHRHVRAGVVHTSLSHLSSIAPLQRPEALRQFPLNRFQFPDLSLDALPRFQRIFDATVASSDR